MREDQESPASFADIAVSLVIALGKMRLDLAQTMIVARDVGMSAMGMEVVAAERERDIALVEQALRLFKDMSEVEPQVRAVLHKQASRTWLPSIVGAAVG